MKLSRAFTTTARRFVSVGDKIPSTAVFRDSPTDPISLPAQLNGAKSLIVGVPGAFSGGCTNSHLPGYLASIPQFEAKGVKDIYVLAVNDVFVLNAWAERFPGLKFIADPKADFVTALDLKFDATSVFGNERAKRFALLVEDNEVKQAFVEPKNTPVDVSAAEKVLAAI